jgi:MFS family permease
VWNAALQLLVFGSLSDYRGRREVILASLVLEIVAVLLFWRADSVAWLVACQSAGSSIWGRPAKFRCCGRLQVLSRIAHIRIPLWARSASTFAGDFKLSAVRNPP